MIKSALERLLRISVLTFAGMLTLTLPACVSAQRNSVPADSVAQAQANPELASFPSAEVEFIAGPQLKSGEAEKTTA